MGLVPTQEVWVYTWDPQRVVFVPTSPQQKHFMLHSFQQRRELVAPPGADVNEALALKQEELAGTRPCAAALDRWYAHIELHRPLFWLFTTPSAPL